MLVDVVEGERVHEKVYCPPNEGEGEQAEAEVFGSGHVGEGLVEVVFVSENHLTRL